MSPAFFPALRVEIDVTPRWFHPRGTAPFFEDLAAIVSAIASSESVALRLIQDIQVGIGGVRIVLAVPAGQATDGFEVERQKLVAVLDALDAVSPRRARITAERAVAAEEARKKAEAEKAAATSPTEPTATPAPPEPSAPEAPPTQAEGALPEPAPARVEQPAAA